jgi:hypothetical protein
MQRFLDPEVSVLEVLMLNQAQIHDSIFALDITGTEMTSSRPRKRLNHLTDGV